MKRFSICLPVKNGMPFIVDCVESILEQTCDEFELQILDNQSTDGTSEWLRDLKDERIIVSFSETPLNIIESWSRVVKLPKLEFLTIIGHDDLLDKEFLAAISTLITEHPDAALYQTSGRLIDSNGSTIRPCRPVQKIERAEDYLRSRFTSNCDVFGTGYVMRSASYDLLGGIPAFERLFFADDALWLSLLRDSYKVCDSTSHYAIRIHSASESASVPAIWGSIIVGLRQLVDFLGNYSVDNQRVREIIIDYAPNFLLSYHRNVAIYAMIEASQAGKRISPEVIKQIEDSLQYCAPEVSGMLWQSLKVRIIYVLNFSLGRSLIPLLWKMYSGLKGK